MQNPSHTDQAILSAVFAKMDVVAMSIAFGILLGMGLFLATAILLMQSTPEGYPVGPHLALLQDYLPGYHVAWSGLIPGFLYGFGLGGIVGSLLSAFWNLAHYMALGVMIIRTNVLAD